jgi:uncharacterized membrane protein YbhN (UPF0104 family)
LKSWAVWVLKIIMTGALLWVTLHKVPWAGVRASFFNVSRPLAGFSIVFFVLATTLVETTRMMFAGKVVKERQPRFRDWLRLFSESRPFFFLLPGAVATEGLIWIRLREMQWRHASCGFALGITRVWGVAGWCLAAAYALSKHNGTDAILAAAPPFLRSPALWVAGGLLASTGALLAPAIMKRFKHLPIAENPGRFNVAMAVASLLSLAIISLSVKLAAAAAGTPLPFHAAMGLMAFFNFAMVLPISVGGFGLQEGLVLLLGLSLGYPAGALIAFSALMHLQRLTLSLVGLGVFLVGQRTEGPSRPVAP